MKMICLRNPSNPNNGRSFVVFIFQLQPILWLPVSIAAQCDAGFTVTNAGGCSNEAVSFQANVINPNWTYEWDFGDGQMANGPNVQHVYNAIGCGTSNFTTTLTVSSLIDSCNVSTAQSVLVQEIPDVFIDDGDIFTETFKFCEGSEYELTIYNESSTESCNTSYTIDWDDGTMPQTVSSFDSISHFYTKEGFSFISLTVESSNGCSHTVEFEFYMGGSPAVGMSIPAGAGSGCSPKTIDFPIQDTDGNSPGTVYTVTISDGSDPEVFDHPAPDIFTHTFVNSSCGENTPNSNDAFSVIITASNPCDEAFSTVEPIRISTPPTASFEVDIPANSCPGEVYEFCEESLNANFYQVGSGACTDLVNIQWSINPNTGFTIVNGALDEECFEVEFDIPGQYSVTLNTDNPCGGDDTTMVVNILEPPLADAEVTATSGGPACVPYELTLSNLSLNAAQACWDISPLTGWVLQSGGTCDNQIEVSFLAAGAYTVSLTAENDCTEDLWDTTIVVNDIPSLSLSGLEGDCGASILTPLATITENGCAITDCSWSFPGGTPSGSTDCEDPGPVNYAIPGGYGISFSATNCCGQEIVTDSFVLQGPPAADASVTSSSGSPACTPFEITYSNESVNYASLNWDINPASGWSFCNGTNASSENPCLNFSDYGTYVITLTATGDPTFDCNDSIFQDTLNIFSLPELSLDAIPDFCGTATIDLSASIDDGGDSSAFCIWTTEGNPATVTDCNGETINYDTAGIYSVGLTVTNICGSVSDSTSFLIQPPITGLQGKDTALCLNSPCLPLETLEPAGFQGGNWVLNGNPISEFCPDMAGSFTLEYTAGSGLCESTDQVIIIVHELPGILSIQDPTTVCEDAVPFLLEANPGDGFWEGPGIDSTGLFDPQSPEVVQTNTLTFTLPDTLTGCISQQNTEISISPLPSFSPGDTSFCQSNNLINLNQLYQVQYASGDTVVWSGPGIQSDSLLDLSLFNQSSGDTTLSLVLDYTTFFRCFRTDTVLVQVIPKTDAFIGTDTLLCLSDQSFQLNEQAAGLPGSWSGPGVNTSSGLVDLELALQEEGLGVGVHALPYSFLAFPGESCETQDDITLTVVNLGDISLPAEDYVCESENSLSLPAPGTPAATSSYWQGDALTDSLTGIVAVPLLSPGQYSYLFNLVSDTLDRCRLQDSFQLTVAPLPQPGWLTTDSIYCIGDSIPFINTSLGAESYLWTFEPGAISTEESPVYLYSNPDKYAISLTAYTFHPLQADQVLCENSFTDSLTIAEPPPAVSFSATPTEGCAPLSVFLTNTSQNSIGFESSYQWLLDGQTLATGQLDSIVLQQGLNDTTYILSLIASNSCADRSFSDTFSVFPQPLAALGLDEDQICSGEELFFQNLSQGNPDAYEWLLGNGQTFNGFEPVPTPYLANDTTLFTISLIATNNCGVDTAQMEATIVPSNAEAFINVFTDTVPYCVGEEVCFTSFSNSSQILWDFGDDNTLLGNPAICHTYDEPGAYTVTLSAFNCGFDIDTAIIEVVPSPDLDISYPNPVCPGTAVTFTNNSDGVSYLWTFGNGDSSTLVSPEIIFDSVGVYPVNLSGTNLFNCSSQLSNTLTVLPPPVAGMILPDTICAGETVSFTNTSLGSSSCLWNFGDGESQTGCGTVTHQYDTSGLLIVTLEVTNAAGCKDILTEQIFVRETPTPDFTFSQDGICTPVSVSFSNNSFNANSYIWLLGDGDTSYLANPTHVFLSEGPFTVTLLALNDGVCGAQVSEVIQVFETPVAQFSTTPTEACAPAAIQMNNSSTPGSGLDYSWNFGDQTSSFMANPSHLYEEPGMYEIELQVESVQCRDTASLSIEIYEPVAVNVTTQEPDCFGDASGSISLNTTSGTSPFEFAWPDGNMSAERTGLAGGDYLPTVTDANGCSWSETITLNQPDSIDIIPLNIQTVTCFGGQDGQLETQATGGAPAYQFSWDTGDDDAQLSGLSSGSYSVTVTDSNGCTNEAAFFVPENPEISFSADILHERCFEEANGRIAISDISGGTGGPYASQLIHPESDTVDGFVHSGLAPGFYQLKTMDSAGCRDVRTYEIKAAPELFVEILEEDQELFNKEELPLPILHNVGNPQISWFPKEYLLDEDLEEPIAQPPVGATTFTVFVEDEKGCEVSDSIRLFVKEDYAIYIPNVFSPNADGANDYFSVFTGAGIKRILEIQIFDRWGEIILFKEKNLPLNLPSAGWDGRWVNNGKEALPGVYVYSIEIEFLDGTKKVFKGDVTLVR